MSKKKNQKQIEYAEYVFQREQLQAAAAAEKLDKAIAVVHAYKDEMDEMEFMLVNQQFETQRKELEEFLTRARDKYVSKLKELGDPRINLETGEII